MAGSRRLMARFARWHIWLGWATGVPLLLWAASGVVMVAKPIEEVHGDQLRRALPVTALPPSLAQRFRGPAPVQEIRTIVQRGVPV